MTRKDHDDWSTSPSSATANHAWPRYQILGEQYLLTGFFVLSWRKQISWLPVPTTSEVIQSEYAVVKTWAELDHHYDRRTGAVSETPSMSVGPRHSAAYNTAYDSLMASTVLGFIRNEMLKIGQVKAHSHSSDFVGDILSQLQNGLTRFHETLHDAYFGTTTSGDGSEVKTLINGGKAEIETACLQKISMEDTAAAVTSGHPAGKRGHPEGEAQPQELKRARTLKVTYKVSKAQ